MEGPKLLDEYLQSGQTPEAVIVSHALDGLPGNLPADRLYRAEPEVLARLGQARSSQGLIAVGRSPEKSLEQVLTNSRLLYLEEVQDPGNVGALLRSARAFGIEGVICAGGADPLSSKVVRASAGALFHLSWCRLLSTPNLPRPRMAAVPRGGCEPAQFSWPAAGVLMIGNEGEGLAAASISGAEHLLTVPMVAGCESLNAAVSGSLLMYSWYQFGG